MKLTDFTLLLVEDDANDIALFQRAFAKSGLVNPVRVVRDGEEAVQYLQGSGAYADRALHPLPSLILLDVKMPRKGGLEVMAWMLEQPPTVRDVPVVMLTSSEERSDVRQAHALGARAYLVKPVAPKDLLDLMKSIGMYWMILQPAPAAPPATTGTGGAPPAAGSPPMIRFREG